MTVTDQLRWWRHLSSRFLLTLRASSTHQLRPPLNLVNLLSLIKTVPRIKLALTFVWHCAAHPNNCRINVLYYLNPKSRSEQICVHGLKIISYGLFHWQLNVYWSVDQLIQFIQRTAGLASSCCDPKTPEGEDWENQRAFRLNEVLQLLQGSEAP